MAHALEPRSEARDGPGGWPRGGPLDDMTLVVRAQEGDAAAFGVLVHRHQRTLYGLAVRILGNTADAEDAVQESFIAAWRRLPEFRGSAAFSSWMYRIVTNRCLNLARSRRPTVPLDEMDETRDAAGRGGPRLVGPPSPESPERQVETNETVTALLRALDHLTVEQRACWVLRELHGMDYAEIARATGSTPDAVRGRIFRARRELAEAMRSWR